MGAVIGSLFIAAILIEEEKVSRLEKIGAKDSKLLTYKKIAELSKKIKKIVKKYEIIEVTPLEIDEAVDGNNTLNLNWLEGKHIADLINKLNPDKAIIDSPSPNIEKFKGYVKKQLKNKDIELIVGHKMEKFFAVGAASILAKGAREEQVLKIEKKVGQSIGSGYPSNPICKKFLKENHEKYPEIIRKSWAPYKTLIKESQQKSLDKF
ncbi:ribonuclease HII [Candidatus Woesearchaeota archaeon]|nr:ribonuclease HII [Candidatus Woesearchaeota archaeon]